MKKLTKWLFAASLLAGCAAGGDEKETIEPQFGKADSLSSVRIKSALEFDQTLDGEFAEDLEFHGYRIYTLPTARITAEVTQAGSSRGLDTTMFIYGEERDGDWSRIAFDDDDGYGALSKLTKLSVEGYTTLMLVIGTPNGLDRGNYRVKLTCTNGECVPPSPIDTNACDSDIRDLYTECVDGMLDNADWGWDDPAERMSVEYCAEEGTVEHAGYACAGGGTDGFCRVSRTELQNAVDQCTPSIKDEYHVYDHVSFGRHDMNASLEQLAQDLMDSADDGEWSTLESMTTDADDTKEIAYTFKEQHERGNMLDVGQTYDRNAYRALRYLPTDVIDEIEAVEGTEYRAVQLNGSYYVAAGAEEWTNIELLHYPATGVIYIITQVAGET